MTNLWVIKMTKLLMVGTTNLFEPVRFLANITDHKKICHPDWSAAEWRDLLFLYS
jgi:hypothetical protein